jgi:hypothetical protein
MHGNDGKAVGVEHWVTISFKPETQKQVVIIPRYWSSAIISLLSQCQSLKLLEGKCCDEYTAASSLILYRHFNRHSTKITKFTNETHNE